MSKSCWGILKFLVWSPPLIRSTRYSAGVDTHPQSPWSDLHRQDLMAGLMRSNWRCQYCKSPQQLVQECQSPGRWPDRSAFVPCSWKDQVLLESHRISYRAIVFLTVPDQAIWWKRGWFSSNSVNTCFQEGMSGSMNHFVTDKTLWL